MFPRSLSPYGVTRPQWVKSLLLQPDPCFMQYQLCQYFVSTKNSNHNLQRNIQLLGLLTSLYWPKQAFNIGNCNFIICLAENLYLNNVKSYPIWCIRGNIVVIDMKINHDFDKLIATHHKCPIKFISSASIKVCIPCLISYGAWLLEPFYKQRLTMVRLSNYCHYTLWGVLNRPSPPYVNSECIPFKWRIYAKNAFTRDNHMTRK